MILVKVHGSGPPLIQMVFLSELKRKKLSSSRHLMTSDILTDIHIHDDYKYVSAKKLKSCAVQNLSNYTIHGFTLFHAQNLALKLFDS